MDPFTLQYGNALRVHLSSSIYSSGWKYPTSPFTLWDGSTRQVYLPFKLKIPFGFHLPFRMEVPIGSIYPLDSIYLLGWKCLSSPFTIRVLFTLQDENALRVTQYRQWITLSPTLFACSPLMHPYMERTRTSRPKILLHICILPVWEVEP